MKLLQLTAVFGGTALAGSLSADNFAARGEATLSIAVPAATTTFYTTSLYTVTKCGTDVINCSTGTALVTSVIAVTTTVCPYSSTWVLVPSSSFPSANGSLSLPTSSISATSPNSSANVPSAPSGSPNASSPYSSSTIGTSSILATSIVLTIQTSVLVSSLTPSSIATATSSSNSSFPSSPFQTTYTDAVPTSRASASSSLVTSHSSSTEVTPTSKSSAGPGSTSSGPSVVTSGTPSSSSISSAPLSNTEAVPTSSLSGTSDFRSSSITLSLSSQPSSGFSGILPSSTTEAVSASKSSATFGSTSPAPYNAPSSSMNSTSSTFVDAITSSTEAIPITKPSIVSGSQISEGTTRITSVLSQTFTSTITVSGSKNLSTVSSATEVISTNSGPSTPQGTVPSTNVQGQPSSGLASGSTGYPVPSTNGTWPSPTIPVQPINAGSRLVGKSSSTVAIVIAFAVTFDNRWLPLMLCLNAVEATYQDMTIPAYQKIARSARLPESDLSKIIDTITGYHILPRQFYQWMFLTPIIVWFVLLDIHFIRFILWRQGPPRNPAMERAVQELVRERDNEEEELNYYMGLHNDWVLRRRAHIPV